MARSTNNANQNYSSTEIAPISFIKDILLSTYCNCTAPYIVNIKQPLAKNSRSIHINELFLSKPENISLSYQDKNIKAWHGLHSLKELITSCGQSAAYLQNIYEIVQFCRHFP